MPLENAIHPHLSLLGAGQEIQLFVADEKIESSQHYSCVDTRAFRRSSWLSALQNVRSIVPTDQGYRAYLSGYDGVRSVFSTDGTNWKLETGVRLPGHWDPAVVRLADGSFLMLYCRASEARVFPAGLAPAGEPGTNGILDEELLSRREVSTANLMGLANRCWHYSLDHGGNMPPDFATLVEVGLSDPRSLISPLNPDPESESYVYIPGQNTKMASDNVLAYEKPETHDYAGTIVLFLDGHAEWMSMEQFESALAKTTERLDKTPGKQE